MKNRLDTSISIIKFLQRTMKGMDAQEKDFIRQLRKNRNNEELIAVYADYLEEQGRDEDALLLRRKIGTSFVVYYAVEKKTQRILSHQFSDLNSLYKYLRRTYYRYYSNYKTMIDSGSVDIVKKEYFLRNTEKFKLKKEDL